MAKKKAKKKLPRTKATSSRKRTPAKKSAGGKLVKKRIASPKKSAVKKAAPRKTAKKSPAKAKVVKNRQLAARVKGVPVRESRRESPIFDNETVDLQERRARSAGQSGGLQGLSDIESADSESVDELVEEGNAFEADVIAGVERAGDADEQEVHTHEVPEDDVPGEYLDEE